MIEMIKNTKTFLKKKDKNIFRKRKICVVHFEDSSINRLHSTIRDS